MVDPRTRGYEQANADLTLYTGYVVATARENPVFLWRNEEGPADPRNDKIVVWTVSGCVACNNQDKPSLSWA
jgi:hypothetical protein